MRPKSLPKIRSYSSDDADTLSNALMMRSWSWRRSFTHARTAYTLSIPSSSIASSSISLVISMP